MLRCDNDFYRPRFLSWCDRNNVDYLVGISKNNRLFQEVDVPSMLVRKAHNELDEKVTATYRFQYQAHIWEYPRWVVAHLEEGELGANLRLIISSRYNDGIKLYYEQYCARGDMENRIKDQQLCLFADWTSNTQEWTNQWRLLLSGFAYTLFVRLRGHLKKTPFERVRASNLRLKLIKFGEIIIRNTRRIRGLMSGAYPYKGELSELVRRLIPEYMLGLPRRWRQLAQSARLAGPMRNSCSGYWWPTKGSDGSR